MAPVQSREKARLVLKPENSVATDFLVMQLKILLSSRSVFFFLPTGTRLDVAVLVLHRGPTACNWGALPLGSGASASPCAVTFGTTLRAAGPGLPGWPTGTRSSHHRRLQELLDKGCEEKLKGKMNQLKSQKYELSDGEFKVSSREMKQAGCLSGSHTVHDFANGHISLSVLPDYIFVCNISHSSLLLSEWCAPPHRSLTGETGNWFSGGSG